VDDEVFRSPGFLDVQALRLLRAFFRIDDPRLRQLIIERAEELAPPAPGEADG